MFSLVKSALDMAENFSEEDLDLFDDAFALSPLNALDVDTLDNLTPKQQLFFVEYLATGSIPVSRKKARVSPATWSQWRSNENFQHVLDTVNRPVAFGMQLANAILLRAMGNLYAMLQDERITVRQWAMDRAFQLPGAFKQTQPENPGNSRVHSPDDVKQLAAELARQLPAGTRIPESPFETVEGQFEILPSEGAVGPPLENPPEQEA